jgi:hypothetical protein
VSTPAPAGEAWASWKDALTTVTLPEWADARLAFDAGGTCWHLVVERGRVIAFGRDEISDPDARLCWPRAEAVAILQGTLSGDDALTATTVVTGDYTGPPAPLNLACRPELVALPLVPHASIGVQYTYRAGPFGDVSYALTFENGRLDREQLGPLADPDVVVEVSYRTFALVRAGEMTVLEALEDGHVDGEIGPLAVLAGISESDEFRDAERATGRHAFALATLGQLHADGTYRQVCLELAQHVGAS